MSIKRTITFNEPLHRYTDEFNKVYTSVTTLIGQYHEQFDVNFWAKKKSDETGLTPAAIKKNWDDIRDFACEKGNKVHKELEDSINESTGSKKFEFDPNVTKRFEQFGYKILINQTNLEVLKQTPLARKYPKIYNYLESKILAGWSMYAEKRIYWADYLVAGTIDCLLIKGKKFIIVDWKTNKDELKFEAGYYKKVNGIKTTQWVSQNKTFYPPLTNLPYCKGNIYTVQLSLYAYLMTLWGFECEALVLFHIRDTNEPKDYNIKFLYSSMKILCTHFRNRSAASSSNKEESFTIT